MTPSPDGETVTFRWTGVSIDYGPDNVDEMMHFEVYVNDVPAAVSREVSFGARETPHQPPDRDAARLRGMLDPAGHPFCLWS